MSARTGVAIGRARPARRGGRERSLAVLVLGALLVGLALAGLRMDLIRVRYGLASAVREEKALLEQQRLLTAELRSLRDPARLARLARERGFSRPDRVVELPTARVADRRP